MQQEHSEASMAATCTLLSPYSSSSLSHSIFPPTRRHKILHPSLLKNKEQHLLSGGTPRFLVVAATEGSSTKSSESEENIPSWARPDSEELPPWARDGAKDSSSSQSWEIPFYVYLLASAITAIAAIGSIFEYANQKPVFGVLKSDSIFYAPLLGFFVFTGIPSSAYLWFKSVEAANKEAEEQDKRDGYR